MTRRGALPTGVLLLALYAVAASSVAAGGEYPSKPVKIINQAPAGNGPDVIARLVFDRLGRKWGQQAVVINRPGAGGLLAAQAAVAAEPDGYTLYQAITSSLLILPVTQTLSFDMQRDLRPIGFIGEQPFLIAISPKLGIKTLPEFIALAKAQPGKILVASAARGSMPHLAAEMLKSRAGIDLTLIPYPATAQALQDLMGGRISAIVESLAGLKGAVDAGSIKPIAVTSLKRLPNLRDIPTVAETIPGYSAAGWFVLMAPAHTADAIVQRVSEDLRAVLGDQDLQQKFAQLGTYVNPMSPSEAAEFVRAEQATWQPLARRLMANAK